MINNFCEMINRGDYNPDDDRVVSCYAQTFLHFGNLIYLRDRAPTPQSLAIFLVGFLSSAVLWCFFMAGLLAWGRRFVTPLFFRLVNLVCGLALGFFALKLFWNTFLLLKG